MAPADTAGGNVQAVCDIPRYLAVARNSLNRNSVTATSMFN